MGHPNADVRALIEACPSLAAKIDLTERPYGVFGGVACLIKALELSADEQDRVFEFFNAMAEQPGADIELLATGAIEMFNDDARTQRLARAKLRGRALELLEEMRAFWGQPDYGPA